MMIRYTIFFVLMLQCVYHCFLPGYGKADLKAVLPPADIKILYCVILGIIDEKNVF